MVTFKNIELIKLFFLLCLVCNTSEICSKNSNWKMVWNDEFNYYGLPDSTKWNYDTAGNVYGWGNKEKQWYNARNLNNTFVNNGTLKIIAHKEQINNKKYSSGRITTKGKGEWLYGKIEVRAKLPKGNGTWPAIWMLPVDDFYGKWPKSGEIDILEHVGFSPDSVFTTIHTELHNHLKKTQKGCKIYLPTATTKFHIYELEWSDSMCKVYIDRRLVFTYQNNNNGSIYWPFDKKFYLILNLAIGGGLGGKKGIDDSLFPHVFEIDYVRIYKKIQ